MHCGAAWLPRGGPDCNTDARWLSAGRVPAVPLHLTCGRHSSHPRSPRFLGAGLKVIKKKLVRKAIDMIKRLADSEGKAQKKQADAEASGELGECARAMLLLLPCRRFPMSLLPAGSSSLLLPPPRFTICPPPPSPLLPGALQTRSPRRSAWPSRPSLPRRVASTPSSGRTLASRSRWASSRTPPTGAVVGLGMCVC